MNDRRVLCLLVISTLIFPKILAQSDEHILTVPFFRILSDQAEQIKNSCVVEQITRTNTVIREKSDWLLLVYMAADNNLNYFAWHNIKQMATTGSNKNITAVIQLNEPGANKKTQRYLIEQNKAILLNEDQVAAGKKLNTGDPQTLIDFCLETINQFPANHIALILWDHGTGYLDPMRTKLINPHELFQLNPSDMMLELNRTDNDFINQIDYAGYLRGICFDETHHSYLSNQKLDYALQTICRNTQRKFDFIGLDACMMQMLEFGCLLQPYADLMVGSQEVELGAGWNYKYILAPFAEKSFTAHEFTSHIVNCYQRAYSRITHDYTLSAVNLAAIPELANNINTVSNILQHCLKVQENNSVRQTLTNCRSKKNCTCFDEPSYLDLGHLYKNILANLGNFKLKTDQEKINQLQSELENGLKQLQEIVLANTKGKNLINAQGLSIYFPEKSMHISYPKTPFAANNNWVNLIHAFIH